MSTAPGPCHPAEPGPTPLQRVSGRDLPDFLAFIRRTDAALPRPPVVVDLDDLRSGGASAVPLPTRHGVDPILLGVSTAPVSADVASLSASLTFTLAPGGVGRSWIDAPVADTLEAVASTWGTAPVAASVLDRVLRATEHHSVPAALELESAAYSMLLASAEFAQWRSRVPRRGEVDDSPAVSVERRGSSLLVELDRPARRNAFNAAMRDQLLEALAVAVADDSITDIRLSGRGAAYCSGGDLDEFGTVDSPAAAHLVRLEQSAGHLVHVLRDRVVPSLHGACIGAGIEIPSFASRVLASDGTWFQLPEVSMGLIPGAGGTVGIPRRIGRWRTAYLALTGQRVGLDVALGWGLVDDRS